ncbi:MAG: NfeD family protein [Bacteroidales bacterium]
MSFFLIVTLVVIGFVLILLEIFILPGTTVAGILGGAALIFAIYQSFVLYGSFIGFISLAAILLLGGLLLFYMLHTKAWQKLSLKTEINAKVNENGRGVLKVGQKGYCISRLAPMGTAEFEEDFFEVQSVLSFIDPKTPVEIVKIEGSKIWVKALSVNSLEIEPLETGFLEQK